MYSRENLPGFMSDLTHLPEIYTQKYNVYFVKIDQSLLRYLEKQKLLKRLTKFIKNLLFCCERRDIF